MRGQPELLKSRLMGCIPIAVWIETDPVKIVHDALFPTDSANPILTIDPGERLYEVDFRCVVGLACFVGGSDVRRVGAVFAACMEAKASRVVARVHAFTPSGEVRTLCVTDSTGVLTWSK